MTEIREDVIDQIDPSLEDDVIAEALRVIDRGLSVMQRRELVSTNEVADLLLDLRLLLVSASAPTADVPVPVGTV